MIVALVSNWGAARCGVANFGRDWAQALTAAGHTVIAADTDPITVPYDVRLVNWDSGTLPADLDLKDSIVFVHHTYRGTPEHPDDARYILSPIRGYATYFPYPVPTYRPDPRPPIRPKTLGVTTLRQEGVDYLAQACGQAGWTLELPDRWRTTSEEIDRLSGCAAIAAYYTDSPGRSLALATMLAAERPTILTRNSQMFEYAYGAEGRDAIYWTTHTTETVQQLVDVLGLIDRDLVKGRAKIPVELATGWTWPMAIRRLEELWTAR